MKRIKKEIDKLDTFFQCMIIVLCIIVVTVTVLNPKNKQQIYNECNTIYISMFTFGYWSKSAEVKRLKRR